MRYLNVFYIAFRRYDESTKMIDRRVYRMCQNLILFISLLDKSHLMTSLAIQTFDNKGKHFTIVTSNASVSIV